MTGFVLFGIGVAASVLVTGSWNAVQSAVETDGNRWRHLSIVILMTLILAGIGLNAPEAPTRLTGLALIAASIWLALHERRGKAPLCLILIAFGAAVAAGLPYQIG